MQFSHRQGCWFRRWTPHLETVEYTYEKVRDLLGCFSTKHIHTSIGYPGKQGTWNRCFVLGLCSVIRFLKSVFGAAQVSTESCAELTPVSAGRVPSHIPACCVSLCRWGAAGTLCVHPKASILPFVSP